MLCCAAQLEEPDEPGSAQPRGRARPHRGRRLRRGAARLWRGRPGGGARPGSPPRGGPPSPHPPPPPPPRPSVYLRPRAPPLLDLRPAPPRARPPPPPPPPPAPHP